MGSRHSEAFFHGRVAIGLLIMQDLLAVPVLFLIRPLLMKLMDRGGPTGI